MKYPNQGEVASDQMLNLTSQGGNETESLKLKRWESNARVLSIRARVWSKGHIRPSTGLSWAGTGFWYHQFLAMRPWTTKLLWLTPFTYKMALIIKPSLRVIVKIEWVKYFEKCLTHHKYSIKKVSLLIGINTP